ncbi:MogA/MoaB family molybdenum cofactor biosynthesis protein, partial [bacterium]|nr:MogA/MoaB family molybdenum cofactor biosynthesis protein [bacterium]
MQGSGQRAGQGDRHRGRAPAAQERRPQRHLGRAHGGAVSARGEPDAGPQLRVAVLVLSDRCSAGLRQDLSGPALTGWLRDRGAAVTTCDVIPDDREAIVDWLTRHCDDGACDVALTCGGTGVSPRDVTPEATRAVLDLELPGFAEAMRAASLRLTPHA